jgi:hypothetical protein
MDPRTGTTHESPLLTPLNHWEHTMSVTTGTTIDRRTAGLTERAARLRAQADDLGPIEAVTFRRRAAELELEAWALTVRSGSDVAMAA